MTKEPNTPLYKTLIGDLKKQIDDGHYRKGDLLPSENELCKRYSTTRPTVRQALGELARMGYIIRRHGKGSIVSEPKNGLGILSLKGSTAGVGRKNLRTEILAKAQKTAWPADFPYELTEVQLTAGCLYLTRLRHVNGLPTLYEETYITDIDLPRFTVHNLEKNSLFETLNKYHNVEIKEGEQKIWAVSADKNLSKLLDVKPGKPLLHMKRSMQTNRPHLVIYSFLYCNTEEYFIQDYF
ncbi:GntR family transcriptional regulator/GntR family transcriptional regulator, frlABCD operon transcriptional regulator [Parapedobacter composti]|uniref:GntR family transcriptional regulator/GntR family transcriptional regulator, frlABCD operon transcriptional regulator n=1 Tax=Parapedobacter composti TaxID=623281 RepID=A0A1I1L008_9SPHI|nr:GntR family transcriptional regulator [Parapedobacter composti]SFC64318.1 GntR family transcriptional regulator/GntR family transcriptional regulator, frlABCD operon transcriptional regulator [Parapedobacter composti]